MGVPLDCSEKSDEELVTLALQDPDWYSCLMRRYEQRLRRYVRRIASFDEEDVEDILQDVFINVYRNLRGFNRRMKFSSWIYRITHNMVISQYRASQRRPQTIGGEDGEHIMAMIADDQDIDRQVDRHIDTSRLQMVFRKLDHKYRDVLVLKYLEGRGYKEISDILQKPVNTVGTLLFRAKQQFREKAKELNITF